MATPQMQIRMSADLRRQVKAKAALLNLTISDVVRELLKLWLEGKVEIAGKL